MMLTGEALLLMVTLPIGLCSTSHSTVSFLAYDDPSSNREDMLAGIIKVFGQSTPVHEQ
jgi:hypothetical protein